MWRIETTGFGESELEKTVGLDFDRFGIRIAVMPGFVTEIVTVVIVVAESQSASAVEVVPVLATFAAIVTAIFGHLKVMIVEFASETGIELLVEVEVQFAAIVGSVTGLAELAGPVIELFDHLMARIAGFVTGIV
jgi:hypothetical protein